MSGYVAVTTSVYSLPTTTACYLFCIVIVLPCYVQEHFKITKYNYFNFDQLIVFVIGGMEHVLGWWINISIFFIPQTLTSLY